MEEQAVQDPITMAGGSVLRIEQGRGVVVSVRAGAVWLTQEGDPADYVLRAGEALRLDRDGLALASALGRSVVMLDIPQAERRARRIGGLRAALY